MTPSDRCRATNPATSPDAPAELAATTSGSTTPSPHPETVEDCAECDNRAEQSAEMWQRMVS